MPLPCSVRPAAPEVHVPTIRVVRAREILDSQGVPTVEAEAVLSDGSRGRASAAGGISAGPFAVELRDGGTRHRGLGVTRAVRHVVQDIGPALAGVDADDQREVDRTLCALDGTPDKSRLGGNAILAVSAAVARATAASAGVAFFRRQADTGGGGGQVLPVPMMNVLTGGPRPGCGADVREFMLVPVGASSFAEALCWCAESHHALAAVLRARGWSDTVGGEGSFLPPVDGNGAAFDLLMAAVSAAGYEPGRDIAVALDVGPVRRPDGTYDFDGARRDLAGVAEVYADWLDRYPLVSVEDPLDGEDWAGWTNLTAELGDRVQLLGDALFASGAGRLHRGIEAGAGNAFLIKPGQAGTLTETLDALALAHSGGYRRTMSHRTGETEDPLIAELAVATDCGQFKGGAPVRGERVAKYNELLRIEEELGTSARYAGATAFAPLAPVAPAAGRATGRIA
ncbi:phosphopyruvate hydratase [Streptomyces mirabilis]|uniref:phosphopyruvate hydratase n=1 Tax=Streptomyces mirabilis TaxID=68239 RepID=UPI003663177C